MRAAVCALLIGCAAPSIEFTVKQSSLLWAVPDESPTRPPPGRVVQLAPELRMELDQLRECVLAERQGVCRAAVSFHSRLCNLGMTLHVERLMAVVTGEKERVAKAEKDYLKARAKAAEADKRLEEAESRLRDATAQVAERARIAYNEAIAEAVRAESSVHGEYARERLSLLLQRSWHAEKQAYEKASSEVNSLEAADGTSMAKYRAQSAVLAELISRAKAAEVSSEAVYALVLGEWMTRYGDASEAAEAAIDESLQRFPEVHHARLRRDTARSRMALLERTGQRCVAAGLVPRGWRIDLPGTVRMRRTRARLDAERSDAIGPRVASALDALDAIVSRASADFSAANERLSRLRMRRAALRVAWAKASDARLFALLDSLRVQMAAASAGGAPEAVLAVDRATDKIDELDSQLRAGSEKVRRAQVRLLAAQRSVFRSQRSRQVLLALQRGESAESIADRLSAGVSSLSGPFERLTACYIEMYQKYHQAMEIQRETDSRVDAAEYELNRTAMRVFAETTVKPEESHSDTSKALRLTSSTIGLDWQCAHTRFNNGGAVVAPAQGEYAANAAIATDLRTQSEGSEDSVTEEEATGPTAESSSSFDSDKTSDQERHLKDGDSKLQEQYSNITAHVSDLKSGDDEQLPTTVKLEDSEKPLLLPWDKEDALSKVSKMHSRPDVTVFGASAVPKADALTSVSPSEVGAMKNPCNSPYTVERIAASELSYAYTDVTDLTRSVSIEVYKKCANAASPALQKEWRSALAAYLRAYENATEVNEDSSDALREYENVLIELESCKMEMTELRRLARPKFIRALVSDPQRASFSVKDK